MATPTDSAAHEREVWAWFILAVPGVQKLWEDTLRHDKDEEFSADDASTLVALLMNRIHELEAEIVKLKLGKE